jgi:deoxyribonucleoside regulator
VYKYSEILVVIKLEAKYDVQLMVKVAQMYYIEGLKQEDIAKQLQISRSLISMILTEAKEVGIVEINILNPLLNNEEMGSELKSLFGLKQCIVVPTAVQDSNTLRKLVAQRAVDVFNQQINDQSTVGLDWGRTCYEFISYYRSEKALKDLNIVPLIGGSSQNAPYFQLNEMVRLLAEKMNGNPYFIHAPALTASCEEHELFMKSQSMQPILEKWQNMNIIIASIGTLPSLTNSDRETYAGEYEIYEKLRHNEAVGDLCAKYFNIQGEFIEEDYCNRIIGIPLENLKGTKKIIGIAAGIEKDYSILGALRTGIIDTFISDEQTAKAVLKLYKLKKQQSL